MRRFAALLIFALPLLAGCSERARLNPFDPANPATGGRPAGFEALADNQSVRLQWQPTPAPGLVGFQVFRLAPGETDYRPLTGVLPPTASSQADFGLLNGAEHCYRLYFVFADGLGGRPAEDLATPGPLRPWVADFQGRTVTRLSADGRHVVESFAPAGGADPVAVDVNPADGRLWAVGPDGDVLVYDPVTGRSTVIGSGLGTLVAVVVDRRDGSGWVADATNGNLFHFLPTGQPASPPELTGLQYPGSLALDRSNRSLWVVEQDGNRVRRYTADGALAATASVSKPLRVAVDSITHQAWVTSLLLGQVVRISPGGTPLDTLTAAAGPIGIAVDALRRRIWVADAAGNQVVAFSPDGTVQFRIAGLSEAREIAVDGTTGEAWVTLTAAGAVARLSPAGRELLRVGGLAGPWGIVLDDVSARPGLTP
jgi:DNA-binding beta-propeller fold protein YncE